MDMNRAAGLQQQAMQSEADANAAAASSIAGAVSAVGSIGAAFAGAPGKPNAGSGINTPTPTYSRDELTETFKVTNPLFD